MKFARGTRFGPYAIESAIGAGGMGVVYRADDSRLGRKVAIKILPSSGTEHLRRFEREARTIGSLNHPNLLTLYDVGDHEGIPFLVTEMLEGESLRARLARGPLKLRESIQIGADVARGLAAAHGAGVIHRDVKPDNIFLTVEGRTKILDFGIAKLRKSTVEMAAVDMALEPTTRDTGVIVGTPGYMAPEQLDGDAADERTDIFALGVVLYEMICGKRAFASASAVEESYAILKTTPDPPKGATKSLARVVLRCLEKRPDARFQSATDLAFALDELDASTDPIAKISRVAIEPLESAVPTIRDSVPQVRAPRKRWWLVAGLCGVAGVLSGILIQRGLAARTAHEQWPTVVEGGARYTRVTYRTLVVGTARLAPDGKSVLYATTRAGKSEIVRSAIGQPSILPTSIAGELLDVSSKGELAILTDAWGGAGTLSRVIEGAGPRAMAAGVTAATWIGDDALAIVRGGTKIELPIGTVLAETKTGRLDLLRASPSGDRIAYVDHPAAADSSGSVVVMDRSGKELFRSKHQDGIEGLAWPPTGDEVWFSDGDTIYGLDAANQPRVVLRTFTRLVLDDVAPDRILVAPSSVGLKMFRGPRSGPFHDVSWFDSSIVEAISADGAIEMFVDGLGTNQTMDDGYAQFLRRGDAPATMIGHGFASTLLPDGSAVISATSPTKLARIPTGIGAPQPIALGKIAQLDVSDRLAISWNGRFLVVRGAEANAPTRLWRIDLTSGEVASIEARAGVDQHPITSDGSTVALAQPTGGVALVSLAGKPLHAIAGPIDERALGFSADDATLFVSHLEAGTIAIDRLDLATDARTPWTRLTPEQTPAYYRVALDATGEVVTYSTSSDASDLYVLERPRP